MRTFAALFCQHGGRAGKPFAQLTPTQSDRSLTSTGLSDYQLRRTSPSIPCAPIRVTLSWRAKVGFPQ
jgi:hypothetical protein